MLNIAGKIDQGTLSIYRAVNDAALNIGVPFVVVGATARDLVMHYGYGAPLERVTRDIDFGIQVPGWDAFYALKSALGVLGFSLARVEHRLYSPQGIPIDIVPFGGNQDENSEIRWPPKNDFVMNVLGFREACENALQVRVQEAPDLDIPVATPEGMMLLKLIAWTDRPREKRTKDATDILYLLKNYEQIPSVSEALYGTNCMEFYGWDLTLAAAHELGAKARQIAGDPTAKMIGNVFDGQYERQSPDCLVGEMSGNSAPQYARNVKIMDAFIAGFMKKQ